jgi:uncharacterized membrane protein YcaP (DUF421 family)
VIGRRELSSLEPFDLILLVVLGDLIQQGVTQNDMSVTGVLLVICTIGLMQVFTSYLSFRFRRVRRMLQGEPVVLVHAGEVFRRNMARERLDTDDLAEKARMNGISTLDDVQWAVLETNGEISFIKRSDS